MARELKPDSQQAIDAARDASRRLYEKAKSPTTEMLLQEARQERLRATNIYERREGGWQVFLRYSENDLMAESGYGADLPEALFHALRVAREKGYPGRDKPPRAKGEPPGRDKAPSELLPYAVPMLAEIPEDIEVPAAILGFSEPEFDDLDPTDDDDLDFLG